MNKNLLRYGKKVQLKNKSGQKIYPLTSSANVMMSDKSGSLDGKLTELEGPVYLSSKNGYRKFIKELYIINHNESITDFL